MQHVNNINSFISLIQKMYVRVSVESLLTLYSHFQGTWAVRVDCDSCCASVSLISQTEAAQMLPARHHVWQPIFGLSASLAKSAIWLIWCSQDSFSYRNNILVALVRRPKRNTNRDTAHVPLSICFCSNLSFFDMVLFECYARTYNGEKVHIWGLTNTQLQYIIYAKSGIII